MDAARIAKEIIARGMVLVLDPLPPTPLRDTVPPQLQREAAVVLAALVDTAMMDGRSADALWNAAVAFASCVDALRRASGLSRGAAIEAMAYVVREAARRQREDAYAS